MAATATFSLRIGSKNPLRVLRDSAQNLWDGPRVSEIQIDQFEATEYQIVKPITIRYERADFGYIASFEDANFAVSGITKQDAYQALEMEILDAFDEWIADESALGPGSLQQLAVLKKHIQKC